MDSVSIKENIYFLNLNFFQKFNLLFEGYINWFEFKNNKISFNLNSVYSLNNTKNNYSVIVAKNDTLYSLPITVEIYNTLNKNCTHLKNKYLTQRDVFKEAIPVFLLSGLFAFIFSNLTISKYVTALFIKPECQTECKKIIMGIHSPTVSLLIFLFIFSISPFVINNLYKTIFNKKRYNQRAVVLILIMNGLILSTSMYTTMQESVVYQKMITHYSNNTLNKETYKNIVKQHRKTASNHEH